MIVFDITNSETFSHAKSLVEEVVQVSNRSIMVLLKNNITPAQNLLQVTSAYQANQVHIEHAYFFRFFGS